MALSGITIGGATGGVSALVVVPDVVGMTQAQAETALVRERGLRITTRAVEVDGQAGTVYSQDPVAGAARSRGTAVALLIVTPPVVPVNIGDVLTLLTEQVGLLETDAKAADRTREILDRLDDLRGYPTNLAD